MRIGGFSRLERVPALTVETPTGSVVAGHEAWSVEKGNRRVCYGLSDALRRLLVAWHTEQQQQQDSGGLSSSRYLFPSRDHPDLPKSVVACMKVFRRVATRARLSGAHVHPHTTTGDQRSYLLLLLLGSLKVRHTVAWTLHSGHFRVVSRTCLVDVAWGTAPRTWRGLWDTRGCCGVVHNKHPDLIANRLVSRARCISH